MQSLFSNLYEKIMKLWQKNIIAIILGSIVGIIFKQHVSELRVIGELFINITKMVSVPLIFFILIKTITDFYGKINVGSVIFRSIKAFTITGILAILISGSVALLMLETNYSNSTISNDYSGDIFNLSQITSYLFPTNFFIPFLEDKVVQVVLLSVFISYALLTSNKAPKVVFKFIEEITNMLLRMIELVIELTPYAIFSYSAWLAGSLNIEAIIGFSKLFYIIILSYGVLLTLLWLYIGLILKINPSKFFRKSLEYQVFALSTGSSKASLAFTLSQGVNQLGISPSKANILIPLGASINMTGLAVYLSSSAIFLAHSYNIELDLARYGIIFVISFVGPIGAAGLAGGALLIMPMLLSSIGIPFEALVLVVAVDPIINGVRTAMNITGDVVVALIIDKQDKELNETIYNQ